MVLSNKLYEGLNLQLPIIFNEIFNFGIKKKLKMYYSIYCTKTINHKLFKIIILIIRFVQVVLTCFSMRTTFLFTFLHWDTAVKLR